MLSAYLFRGAYTRKVFSVIHAIPGFVNPCKLIEQKCILAHVISSKALEITNRAVMEYDNIYIVFYYCSGSASNLYEDTT
jgi:hypothetical protein